LVKYHLTNDDKEKTVIINKTEKVTVQENFSLSKTAERVSSAVVKVNVYPEKGKKDKITTQYVFANGVILTSDGLIVTPANLSKSINDKSYLEVVLADGKTYEAKVVAKDDFNNIIFLKIEADNLPVVPFGESDKMENGEKIIMTGRAPTNNETLLGLNIVRYADHNIPTEKKLDFLFSDVNTYFLVADREMNDIYAGGAVVDFQGTMVGLISPSISDFSDKIIPVSNIQKSLNRYIQGWKDYPKLGAYYLNITPELAKLNNLPVKQGALIYTPSGQMTSLVGSQARKLGLKYGDIITKVNNQKINNDFGLAEAVAFAKHKEIVLDVLRGDETIKLTIKSEETKKSDNQNNNSSVQ